MLNVTMGGVEISFDIADYIVFVFILLVPVGMSLISRYTGAKQTSTSEYLMGGRKMSVFPVAISLAVSYLSGMILLLFLFLFDCSKFSVFDSFQFCDISALKDAGI